MYRDTTFPLIRSDRLATMPRVTQPTAFEDDPFKKPRIGVGKSKKSQRGGEASVNDGKKTSVSEGKKKETAEEDIGKLRELEILSFSAGVSKQ